MSVLETSLKGWTNFGATASVGQVNGTGWHTLAELALDARKVADVAASVYGTTTTVGGTFLLARAARAVAEPSLHALLDAQCLPLIQPAAVSVHLNDTGRFDAVAFRAASDEPANATVFASALVDSFGDLVEALRAVIPVGRRGLWGLVGDAVGGAGVSLAHRHTGALSVAAHVLDELAHLHGFTARPTWRVHDSHVELERGSCCLAFHLDGHGYCETCPVGRRDVHRSA